MLAATVGVSPAAPRLIGYRHHARRITPTIRVPPVADATSVLLRSTKCKLTTTDDATEIEDVIIEDESQFIEVGIVVKKHGVRGEVLVRSLTSFGKQRFEEPGVRWMRVKKRGKQEIKCVKLLKGRFSEGKIPCWLVTLEGIRSPEQAADYIGATMLVKRADKPAVGDGAFYVPDLIGMNVILRDSGKTVGVVAGVHNFGANDLLHVEPCDNNRSKPQGRIWIPFVNAIVPEVNIVEKKILIVPPEGLLEVNRPGQAKPKPKLDFRDRKQESRERKLREQLEGLKKSIKRAKQRHVLKGLSLGESDAKETLMKELRKIDFKALQGLLDGASKLKNRKVQAGEKTEAVYAPLPRITEVLEGSPIERTSDASKKWWMAGLKLIAENKVALAGIYESNSEFSLESDAKRVVLAQELAVKFFPEVHCQIPWCVMVETRDAYEAAKSLLKEQEYFGLAKDQVWVIEEESMPCFTEEDEHAIIMETPWKIRQAGIGDGSLLKALNCEKRLELLLNKGVEYVHVYQGKNANLANPAHLGFFHQSIADVSVKVMDDGEESIRLLKKQVTSNAGEGDDEGGDDDSEGKGKGGEISEYEYEVVRRSKFEVDSEKTKSDKAYVSSESREYVVCIEYLKRLLENKYEAEYELINMNKGQVKAAVGLHFSLLSALLSSTQPQKVCLVRMRSTKHEEEEEEEEKL